MKIYCPTCDARLAAAQLNVASDVAVCPNCDGVFPISAAIASTRHHHRRSLPAPTRPVPKERVTQFGVMAAS